MSHEHDFRPHVRLDGAKLRWEPLLPGEPRYPFRCDCGTLTLRPVDAAVAEKLVFTSDAPVESVVFLSRDAPSARWRVYIGGPLNNEPVQQIGEHWSHFRDDDGNPIPDEVGDTEWNGPRERFYYWAVQAPGGATYVHLTWIDKSGRVTG